MTPPVTRKRFAFLATDGVEEATLLDPWRVLAAAGGEPELVSPGSGNIRAMRGITNHGANKEPKWRHNRPELTTGYDPRWGNERGK